MGASGATGAGTAAGAATGEGWAGTAAAAVASLASLSQVQMVAGQLPVSQECTHHSFVAASVRDLHMLKSPATVAGPFGATGATGATGAATPLAAFAASFAAFSAARFAASIGSSVTTSIVSSEHSHIVGQFALLSLHVDVHHSSLALSDLLLQALSSPTITSGTPPSVTSRALRRSKLAD